MAGKSSKKKQKSAPSTPIAARMAEMKDGILQMESFIKEAAALAETEGRRIEEIKNGFEEAVVRLQDELRTREEALLTKDSVLEDMERSLTSQIGDLEDQLKEKDELIANQGANLQAARSARQDGKLAELEARIKEKEDILLQKDAIVREVQERLGGLTAQVGDLEGQVKIKGELLESRDAEIKDLTSKMDGLRLLPQESAVRGEENVILLEDPEPRVEQQAAETKVKVIERSMHSIMGRQGRIIVQGQGKEPKKSRLISLLAPSKK